MATVIRTAVPADAAVLADLAGQLGYPTSPAEMLERLHGLAAHGRGEVLVAESEGVVRGWLHVLDVHTLETPAHGEIAGLVVDAGARSRGVGRELVAAAEAWAAAHGLPLLRVRSNVVRERAHRFYERLGFRRVKTSAVFAKEL